ncbi:MAG: histidine kinase [Chitinophagales bacterium]
MLLAIQKTESQDFEYVFKSYGVDEGMPTSQTFKIIQDKQGYIWFGTGRGIVKYNGYEFKRFTIKDGLSTNLIFHVHADENNTIYLIGDDYKVFCIKNDIITEFKGNSEIIDIDRKAQILSLATDKDNLYIAFWNDSGKPSYFKFKKDGTLLEKKSQDYGVSLVDVGDDAIIHINGYFVQEQLEGVSLSYNDMDTILGLEQHERYLAYTAEGKNVVYFSIQAMLFKIENNKLKYLKTFQNTIFNLAVDQQGHLYVALYQDGLIKFENGDIDKPTQLLRNQSTISILFDDHNNLWCGSGYKGLQFSTLGNFKHLKFKERVALINLIGDEDKLLAVIDKEEIYKVSSNEFIELKQEKKSLAVVLQKEHLYRYYVEKNKILNFENECFDDHKFKVNMFYVDYEVLADTQLFLLGRGEILLYSEEIEKSIVYNIPFRLNCFAHAVDDVFLVGTSSGIKVANLNNRFLNNYSDEDIQAIHSLAVEPYYINHPFFNSSISDIVIEDNIRIFTSLDRGLWIEKDSISTWLTEEEGMISDNLEKIIYQDNYIIVSSNTGLSVLDENYNIRNFTTANGLLTNEVDDFYLKNDTLWVASKVGITLLSLNKKNQETKAVSPLIFKRLSINDREWPVDRSLTLRHIHTRLEVEYEALNYIKEGKINYKYKLEGLEDRWNYTPNRNIRYTNLPAGKFKLLMSYELEDKKWTDPIVLLSFKKRIPIMIHWVFIVVYILLLIWLVIKLTLFINRRERLKQQNELTILELERKALQAQMNPHFMFNSLSSLKYMIMKDKKRESEDYLTKFSKYTRLTLNHSTEKFIPIDEEIELLNNYLELELTRFESKFEYEIVNKLIDPNVKIPPMLVQPFIENAIIHGFDGLEKVGRLSIVFQDYSKDTLLCLITDNGVGRRNENKSKRHKKSFGMSLVLNRLKLLHKEGNIKIIDLNDGKETTGTRIELNIPFIQ